MKLFYEKYIKLAHIGRGANAHVYKVKHAELGYIRAIKILNDYIETESEKVYQSFLKECRTLLTIGNGCHPNIVRIYGPSLVDNHAIVEMDYIQGTTLDSYIKDVGFIEYEEVKRFIHDIVGALAYTHHDIYSFLMDPDEDNLTPNPQDGRRFSISPAKESELVKKYGIAHNDLHSNNVMRRDYDGSFVLLDFGLAVQDGKCVKSSKMGDGSPEYQAPEKFDSDTVSPRSDVYSLGILMYELLAGRVPFELKFNADGAITQSAVNDVLNHHIGSTPPDILPLRKQAFERVTPGAIYERDYPEWLDQVIMKCLAKKPEDRYADARALLDDINAHLANDSEASASSAEVNRLKADLAQMTSQWVYEKEEKERIKSESARLNSENTHQSDEALSQENEALKDEISRLKDSVASYSLKVSETQQLKLDIENLKYEINRQVQEREKLFKENQALKQGKGKKGGKVWKLTTILFFLTTIGAAFWGYLIYENMEFYRNIYFDNSYVEPEYTEATTDTIEEATEVVAQPAEAEAAPEVVTETRIEYRTPPAVQQELEELRAMRRRLEQSVSY